METTALDFVVIDTEGTRQLREIAIINSQGELMYEAFNAEHPDNCELYASDRVVERKPLKDILSNFTKIIQDKTIVFHHAAHDLAVLKDSFKKANLTWKYLKNIRCTYAMAQKHFPNRYSHSLEHLAKQLNLKVDNCYFNPRQAHTARYDAHFTYQLYLNLIKIMNPSTPVTINPFSSSRVDNPFQNHPDNPELYRPQYTILESIIDDIKYDRNHQSKGVVVIGEPGTGKTHLIMRLARKRLQHNRLSIS